MLPVGHCLSGSAGARSVQQKMQIASRNAREARRRMHVDSEAEHIGVKCDCSINIGDDVSDANSHIPD